MMMMTNCKCGTTSGLGRTCLNEFTRVPYYPDWFKHSRPKRRLNKNMFEPFKPMLGPSLIATVKTIVLKFGSLPSQIFPKYLFLSIVITNHLLSQGLVFKCPPGAGLGSKHHCADFFACVPWTWGATTCENTCPVNRLDTNKTEYLNHQHGDSWHLDLRTNINHH